MSFKKESFTLIRYLGFKAGVSGGGQSPKDCIKIPTAGSVDLGDLEEGMVVESCTVAVETALAGATNIAIGDDDTSGGFLAANSMASSGTAIKGAGTYISSAPKYYLGAKKLKATTTGASATAGLISVCLKGFRV